MINTYSTNKMYLQFLNHMINTSSNQIRSMSIYELNTSDFDLGPTKCSPFLSPGMWMCLRRHQPVHYYQRQVPQQLGES